MKWIFYMFVATFVLGALVQHAYVEGVMTIVVNGK